MDKQSAAEPPRVLLLTCISAISFFLFGYDTGVVSGAFEWVRDDYDLSDVAYEALVASTTASAALGALVAAGLNERYGRKPAILVAAVLFAAGSALMASLPSSFGATPAFYVLLTGRVLLGVAIGIATVTVPMYISEAAPPERRGFLLVLNDLSVVTGQFIAGLVNVGMDRAGQLWRVSVGLALVPGAVQLVGFVFLPESPRWLFSNGNNEEGRSVLMSLRSSAAAVEEEVEAIREEVQAVQRARRRLGLPPSSRVSIASAIDMSNGHGLETEANGADEVPDTAAWAEQDVRPASLADLSAYWKHLPARRAMTLGIVLMAMNQFAGINTVMYYSVAMMEMAGFDDNKAVIIACACDFAQMVGVLYSLFRMDVDGRRHLALQSTLLVAPTLLMLSISFWIHSGKLPSAARASAFHSTKARRSEQDGCRSWRSCSISLLLGLGFRESRGR
uniref:Hexose transporter 1 n=1 Tax=Pinguiococcus pyrenoidosus TaxID=172671 RepID=A0A6U0WVU3_9STRA|mmetsp:Transcript_978/g.4164  ORF Transcript_978/g.4164 Transcript_978/m.4164 type:complete len:448 (+) Transcript_978:86-1429(+)